MLYDRFNRIHNYLRISITDSCNFRCSYCMPGGTYHCMPSSKLMSPNEINTIAGEFIKLGVQKIRLTGGEPLTRKDFPEILSLLAEHNIELTLTTNGSLIHQYIQELKAAGVESVNVSLDSLKPETFKNITKRDEFNRVYKNIFLLLKNNIRVKLNVVAIKDVVENEMLNFIQLTKDLPLHVRFIEFMPFKGNSWDSSKVLRAGELLDWAGQHFDIVKLNDEPHATARKYKVIGHEGTVAFISSMSNHFCGECNRMRLTAEGKMKNCLFGKEELDLLGALRSGNPIEPLIKQSLHNKFASMGGQFENGYECTDGNTITNRSMVSIGG